MAKKNQDLKIEYFKDGDILVIKMSKKPFEYAEMEGSVIVHYSNDDKPVRIEVLNASRLLDLKSTIKPREVKRSVFATA